MTFNSEQSITIEEVIQQLQAGTSMPAELLEVFSEEADDHLRTIYDGLGRLQQDSANVEALSDVRRASHTLKGAAGAVGMQAATRLSHRMEDLLDRLADRKESVSEQQLKLLLATADQLQGLSCADLNANEVAEQIVGLYRQYTEELGEPDASGLEPASSNQACNDSNDALPGVNESQTSTADPQPVSPAPLPSNSSTEYLRVPLERLDGLVGLLGEMVVNRSEFQQRMNEFEARIDDMQNAKERLRDVAHQVDLQQSMKRANGNVSDGNLTNGNLTNANATNRFATGNGREGFDQLEFEQYSESYLLEQSLAEADKDVEIMSDEFRKIKVAFDSLLRRQRLLVNDAQKGLMRIRMVPLNGIANRLERTLRIVANKVDRPVSLQIEGGDIELDKTVLDAITDPLMHLIRNAVDHGVEDPQVRAEAGKPETACLRIQAINHGTQITLRICDDGAGINLEAVRNKAIEKGLITANQKLTDDEIHALIFNPGFSTAAELTDISGRGVGMDVVGDAIAKLKGTIRVESKRGSGTTFTIQLPTALGISRAVVVESCGKSFALPMRAINQILQFDPESILKEDASNESAGSPRIKFGDASIPVVSLSNHLQLGSKRKPLTRACPMLIVANQEGKVAVTIDKIFGCREIVIKPLGNHLNKVPGIAGVTIVGDGTVLPVLETADIGISGTGSLVLSGQEFLPGREISSRQARRNLAMVIDDSISVRRVTEKVLKNSGWEVVTAKDGIDALEKLADLVVTPDVFLCDMEMPRMDGLELIRQIREQSEFEMTPIVMVTSRSSEKHRQKAFEAGATDFVVKPFNEKHLLETITQLVQSSHETVIA